MSPPPASIALLAEGMQFTPSDPNDPNSDFTLKIEQVRRIGALLGILMEYIRVENAKCGKTETPETP